MNLQVSLCLSHHPSCGSLPNMRIQLDSRMWDFLESQLESELLYDGRFTANQFALATRSLRLTTSNFIFQINTYGYSPSVTSFLTRGLVCSWQLLLVIASTVILRSDYSVTRDHILLSQIRDSHALEGQVRWLSSESESESVGVTLRPLYGQI
jgi:hypothetical protein